MAIPITRMPQPDPRVGAARAGTDRLRSLWHPAAVAVVWATTTAVAAIWVAGGGIADLGSGMGGALTAVGRLFGLAAANLMLLQVLLMARVPVFERGFGRSAITRAHRITGFGSMALLAVHVVLVVAGYAVTAGVNPLRQAWQFVVDYPGVLLAVAGTGLLVGVALTSRRARRARMRYESWHLLHLYGYLGVGLVIPHMLWTGADFSGSVAASAYWVTLWVVTAACVLWFRVITPLTRSARHGMRVVDVRPDGPSGITVRMRGRALHRLHAEAGQFFVWRFLDGPGWSRGHPFSLTAPPAGDELSITARRVGDGTDRLAVLRRGTRVLFEGPYGAMTGRRRTGLGLLMIGAGAGVVPLVALLESEPYLAGQAILITRDSDADGALCADRITRLERERGLACLRIAGPRAHGRSAWLPAGADRRDAPGLLRAWCAWTGDPDGCDVYVCGPPAWMSALHVDLAAARIAPERIHAEHFGI